MAKLMASDSGTNRNLATPDRKNIGMKTMQMHSVETNAGTGICCAPSRMAWTVSLPIARLRLMFSISTVASSTRIPTASARPPKVIILMVCPNALRHRMLTRMDRGMEKHANHCRLHTSIHSGEHPVPQRVGTDHQYYDLGRPRACCRDPGR